MEGLMSQSWEPDTLSANKCWKKYFRSNTFANDDDNKWGPESDTLGDFTAGAPRSWHGQVYLLCCFFGRMPLDDEIQQVLLSIREDVIRSVRRLHAFRRPELISHIVGLRGQEPLKKQFQDEATERLEQERRFLSYVESVL
jgi:hypothetical protein